MPAAHACGSSKRTRTGRSQRTFSAYVGPPASSTSLVYVFSAGRLRSSSAWRKRYQYNSARASLACASSRQ